MTMPRQRIIHDGPGTLRPGIPLPQLAMDAAMPRQRFDPVKRARWVREQQAAKRQQAKDARLIDAESPGNSGSAGGRELFENEVTALLRRFQQGSVDEAQFQRALTELCAKFYDEDWEPELETAPHIAEDNAFRRGQRLARQFEDAKAARADLQSSAIGQGLARIGVAHDRSTFRDREREAVAAMQQTSAQPAPSSAVKAAFPNINRIKPAGF